MVPGRGDRVLFRSGQGPWVTPMRIDDTLYGFTNDPLTEAVIMIRFDRAGTT
jgi:hypothetical protein